MMRGLVAALLTMLGAGAAVAQDDLPPEMSAVRIRQRPGAQVPLDLPFFDESGRPVRLRELFDGKPVVLVLAYIKCPRLCSVVLSELAKSLRDVPYRAGKDFRVVVVSFDPREKPDLAARAKETFVEEYGRDGAQAGVHFLTGEGVVSKRLADLVGFRYIWDPGKGEYRHSAGIMLLTPEGKVARYLFGTAFAPRDLRLGLVETSEGGISAPVDNALLLTCFSYDPTTGKYSLAAMKLMRLGGVVTVLVVALWLGRTWLRDRRKARAAAA
ncbi:MAG: SCO family protein [Gemmataceae bacterium]|nr:SCO family protein [Gemmataceae bacterium]